MTKKLFYFVIAAALICSSNVFTSCTNDDNPAAEPDLNLGEMILGKWIETEVEGRPALTNEKAVTTFVSATKALYSSSLPDYNEKQAKWSDRREYAVKITGNKVSLTGHPESDPTITLIEDFFISSITATEIV